MAPCHSLIESVAELRKDHGPADKQLAIPLSDGELIAIGQMVDGLRRHIGHSTVSL
jgi:hypothetical protein